MKEKYRKQIQFILNEETLDENTLRRNPFDTLKQWYNEAIDLEVDDPTAAALATCDKNFNPSVRMILIKAVNDYGLIFFTNYESRKAVQIETNNKAALVFYWPALKRQLRIEGVIEKISEEMSDEYYDSRPEGSRIGAWASPQSKIIPNREYLDNLKSDFELAMKDKQIRRPDFWGGFILKPDRIEFWKEKSDRLHDRIEFKRSDNEWLVQRLAP